MGTATTTANSNGASTAVNIFGGGGGSGTSASGDFSASSSAADGPGYAGGGQEATSVGRYSSLSSAQRAINQVAATMGCAALAGGQVGSGGTGANVCSAAAAAGAANQAAAKPVPPPAALLGAQAVLRLQLPVTMPHVGPPPSVNQWKESFVGYPLWLWSTGASTVSTQMMVMGYPVTLTATRAPVHFDMGDGGSVDCATSTPWTSGVGAGVASPDCGYVYQKAGSYQVTAIANWTITWTALGQSGTIPEQKAGRVMLPVGELESVVTAGGGH